MKKVIDTQTVKDPDIFGETLREFIFTGEGYGCYSTFDVADGFIEVDKLRIPAKVFDALNAEEVEDRVRAQCYYNKDLDILVAWYWDGDGTLLIKEGDRKAINSDCKKSYNWEWMD